MKVTLNRLASELPGGVNIVLNNNMDALEKAFDNTLSLNGALPNAMKADIDLNGNDVLNVHRVDTAELKVGGEYITEGILLDLINTNTFTDAERLKLAGIEDGAQVNPSGSDIVSSINTVLGQTSWQSGGGGGGISDGDKGDITVSGGGTVWSIDSGVVTLSNLENSVQVSLGKADTAVQPGSLSTVATTGAYSDLTGKPTLFDGAYSSLSGKPTLGSAAASNTTDFATAAQGTKADTAVQPGSLATVATTGAYSDLTGKPTLFDGAYSSLTGKPTIPIVSDAVYGAGWDANLDAPTKNAVYDKIESLAIGAPEGTAVKSTGETGGSKFLREDGDGTCSWQAIPGGGDALTSSPLSQFAATTSAQLAGVMSDETGSGALVFATNPVLVTPSLGTPSVLNLTNATALPQSGILNSTSYAIGLGQINLGHASDTTISRVAAGRIAVEGAELAKLASPALTGTPTAPTAAPGTNTTQLATTAFVGAALALVAINAQTGTTYTLVLADGGKKVTMNNGSANTLTVPANASVAFPIGTILNVTQIGAGVTTITGATGVTINGVSTGSAAIAARWTSATLTKTATDTWLMEGNHAVVA